MSVAMNVNDETTDSDGTYRVGRLRCGFLELIECFGEPLLSQDYGKVDFEWVIEFTNGVVLTVYNWKNGPSAGVQGPITQWNIGGSSVNAFPMLRPLLPESMEVCNA